MVVAGRQEAEEACPYAAVPRVEGTLNSCFHVRSGIADPARTIEYVKRRGLACTNGR